MLLWSTLIRYAHNVCVCVWMIRDIVVILCGVYHILITVVLGTCVTYHHSHLIISHNSVASFLCDIWVTNCGNGVHASQYCNHVTHWQIAVMQRMVDIARHWLVGRQVGTTNISSPLLWRTVPCNSTQQLEAAVIQLFCTNSRNRLVLLSHHQTCGHHWV